VPTAGAWRLALLGDNLAAAYNLGMACPITSIKQARRDIAAAWAPSGTRDNSAGVRRAWFAGISAY